MKIFEIIKKYLWQILSAIFIVLIAVLLYQRLAYTFITAEFNELRPIKGTINVFYKGYKIGKVLYVKPNTDFTTTYMKIALFHKKDLRLPKNITMKLQREKDKWRKIDYIDIIYPNDPEIAYLRNGDVVFGKSTVDIETFLSSQEADSLDNMKEQLENTVGELQDTIGALKDLFTTLNDIAIENKKNLKSTTDNLENTTKNIEDLTIKLNRSIKQENLNQSMTNLEETTQSMKETTKELQETVRRVNEFAGNNIPNIETGVNNTGCIINNLNEITCGLKNTLKKRFGGIRLLFGRAIGKECTKCAD